MSAQLSAQLRQLDETCITHWCPGCQERHYIDTQEHPFNGNCAKPSFSKPIVAGVNQCQYSLVEGELVFSPMANHEFAGKHVPLPELKGYGA